MNKTAIIEFVDFARDSLENLVRLRAYEYGVSRQGRRRKHSSRKWQGSFQ
jgi:hypothetical protein